MPTAKAFHRFLNAVGHESRVSWGDVRGIASGGEGCGGLVTVRTVDLLEVALRRVGVADGDPR